MVAPPQEDNLDSEASDDSPILSRLDRFVEEQDRPGQQVRLRMDSREPFPEQRMQVLKQRLTDLDGQILSAEGRTVRVEIPSDTVPEQLDTLFHWKREVVEEPEG